MRTKLLAVLFLGISLLLTGCGSKPAPISDEDKKAQTLLTAYCISCHGEKLDGTSKGPALNTIGDKLTAEEIYTVLWSGTGGAASQRQNLNKAEMKLIGEYLAKQKSASTKKSSGH